MKRWVILAAALLAASACEKKEEPAAPAPEAQAPAAEQPAAATPPPSDLPPLDANNIVSIAVGSKDHKTLVAALKAANYVIGVSNPGPLTVFAPTDAAFAKLPAGTVDNLVKPENIDQLRHILQHHVVPSAYAAADLKDGQVLGMVDGGHCTVKVVDGKITVDGANVLASIKASNGVVHIIDTVLLPTAKP